MPEYSSPKRLPKMAVHGYSHNPDWIAKKQPLRYRRPMYQLATSFKVDHNCSNLSISLSTEMLSTTSLA